MTGLFLGIACGLFFGELVRPLDFVASAFIRLLQMAVLPYIVFSLTAAVGRLSLREARFLAGVARSAHDPALEAAATALARDYNAGHALATDLARISGMVQDRLSRVAEM